MALTFADEAIVVTNPEVSSVRDSDRILGTFSPAVIEVERTGQLFNKLYLIWPLKKKAKTKKGWAFDFDEYFDEEEHEGFDDDDNGLGPSDNEDVPGLDRDQSMDEEAEIIPFDDALLEAAAVDEDDMPFQERGGGGELLVEQEEDSDEYDEDADLVNIYNEYPAIAAKPPLAQSGGASSSGSIPASSSGSGVANGISWSSRPRLPVL